MTPVLTLRAQVYREELRNCNPPVLPYLGVYLTDLTFIEDGNKNTVHGLINFNKRRLLYRVLREIEQVPLLGILFSLVFYFISIPRIVTVLLS